MKTVLVALNAKYIHSCLAVRCLQKFLQNHGVSNVSVYESTINDHCDVIVADLVNQNADLYGFSTYIWNIEQVLKICSDIKKIKPLCKILLGGPEVSFEQKELMRKNAFIDYIIAGEGEIPLLHFLQSDCKDYTTPGLSFQSENGVVVNPPGMPVEELDILPFAYHETDLYDINNKIVYYESSRGCPYNCSYCISSTIKGVRAFALSRVKDELQFFFNHKVPLVKFVDRTFNYDKKRTLELFRFCVEHHQNTRLHFEIYPNLLDDEIISYLSTVPENVFQFEIGIQTTNQQTLDLIGRKNNSPSFQTIQRLQKAGNIPLHLDLIAGLPKEDYRSFQKSFDEVYALRPDMLQLGFLKLLKGTRIRKEASFYHYQYLSRAPYEVLSNNSLNYYDLRKLKEIEYLVDRYYNSGSFHYSLEYLLKDYISPFSFFEELREFFQSKGLLFLKVAKDKHYEYLYAFSNQQEFLEYLRLDYFIETGGRSQLPFIPKSRQQAFHQKCFAYLTNYDISIYYPQYTGLPVKEQIKYIRFEQFDFNQRYTLMIDSKTKKLHNVSANFV